MFSIAFGIILSISRMAKEKIERETMDARPIVETEDDIRDRMNDLRTLEDIDKS